MQDHLFLFWLIGGLLLMVAEFVLPGGIVFFLGLAATLVSLLAYAGWVDGWLAAFTTWFIGSLALVFGLRGLVQRIVPAEVVRGSVDEDLDAYGHAAEIIQRIPAGGEGRIAFRGSTWSARNYHTDADLEVGTQVRIVFRENLVWVVEAVQPSAAHESGRQG